MNEASLIQRALQWVVGVPLILGFVLYRGRHVFPRIVAHEVHLDNVQQKADDKQLQNATDSVDARGEVYSVPNVAEENF